MTATPLIVDASRTAVINVHWQHDIVSPDGAFGDAFAESVSRNQVIPAARELVGYARETDMLVIWVRAAFRPGYPELPLNTGLNHAIKNLGALVDGSPGAEIIPEMGALETELVISHPGTSAFPTTALDDILRVRGIETLLFTGVATNITVEGTARDAANRRYNTVLMRDACAAANDEAHEATLNTFTMLGQVARVREVRAALPDTALVR